MELQISKVFNNLGRKECIREPHANGCYLSVIITARYKEMSNSIISGTVASSSSVTRGVLFEILIESHFQIPKHKGFICIQIRISFTHPPSRLIKYD